VKPFVIMAGSRSDCKDPGVQLVDQTGSPEHVAELDRQAAEDRC
jgi:hypothetical protein